MIFLWLSKTNRCCNELCILFSSDCCVEVPLFDTSSHDKRTEEKVLKAGKVSLGHNDNDTTIVKGLRIRNERKENPNEHLQKGSMCLQNPHSLINCDQSIEIKYFTS